MVEVASFNSLAEVFPDTQWDGRVGGVGLVATHLELFEYRVGRTSQSRKIRRRRSYSPSPPSQHRSTQLPFGSPRWRVAMATDVTVRRHTQGSDIPSALRPDRGPLLKAPGSKYFQPDQRQQAALEGMLGGQIQLKSRSNSENVGRSFYS